MSMSTHVYGVRPADDEYKKMLKVYNACVEAGIDPPNEVVEFFDGEIPHPDGQVVHLGERDYLPIITPVTSNSGSGYEVRISDLIERGFKSVRFVNSW